MTKLETNPSKVVMDPQKVPKEIIRELLIDYDDIDWIYYDVPADELGDLYEDIRTFAFKFFTLDGPAELNQILNPDTRKLEYHRSHAATRFFARGFVGTVRNFSGEVIFYPWMIYRVREYIKPEDLNC